MGDADAPALVAPEIDDRPPALLGDALHGQLELRAAIAPLGGEHVAGQAFGVHPDEDVVGAGHLAPHQGDVLGAVDHRLVGVGGEVAERRRDAGLRHPPHELLPLPAVADEVGDRDHDEAVLPGKAFELRQAGHRAGVVVVDDLAQHGGRVEAGQAGQVDAGLGVAGPLQHAALPVAEREDVAGPVEVVGAGVAVDEGLDRGGPVGGRDAGARARLGVDRDGEGGALRLGVVGHHQRDAELVEAGPDHRQADHAAGVADHEGDPLGGDLLGGNDEVALVLPVGVVDDDDELPPGDGGDRLVDRRERHRLSPLSTSDARHIWPPGRPPGSPGRRGP